MYSMRMPRIGVVLNWRNEINKSGLYSVHIRIKIGENARYYKIEIPQKIKLDQWEGKEDSWIKNTHPFAFKINNKISEKRVIIRDLIKRSYNTNKNLSFETIFLHLKRKGDRNSFFDYMEAFTKNPPEKFEENTIKKYRTCLNHLRAFKKQLFFSDIDNELIQDFHKYMQTVLKLAGGACKNIWNRSKE